MGLSPSGNAWSPRFVAKTTHFICEMKAVSVVKADPNTVLWHRRRRKAGGRPEGPRTRGAPQCPVFVVCPAVLQLKLFRGTFLTSCRKT